MPQLVIFALIGAGIYAGYRWLAHTSEAITAAMRRAEDESRQRASGQIEKDLGALEYDPASGVYRPVKRG
jgi:type II secretory pathway component PulJ